MIKRTKINLINKEWQDSLNFFLFVVIVVVLYVVMRNEVYDLVQSCKRTLFRSKLSFFISFTFMQNPRVCTWEGSYI